MTNKNFIIQSVVMVFVLVIAFGLQSESVMAQSSPSGTTPAGLAPGAPAGSFALSGFENINPYSGNMSFSLPFLEASGRGSVSIPMRLTIEKKWVVNMQQAGEGAWPWMEDEMNGWCDWFRDDKGFSPGALVGRQATNRDEWCVYGYFMADRTLTRLTFTTPDGTEYELVDNVTKGQPFSTMCNQNPFGRGTVFVSSDASGVTFTSDTPIYDYNGTGGTANIFPSGYMMMRDGTRYRIEMGRVMWIRDRNGNKMSFTYMNSTNLGRVASIKDSLNREINIEYDVQDVEPYGLCDRITYKGFGGATRIIRISYKSLNNVLRSGYSIQTHRQLWPLLYPAGTPSESQAIAPYNVSKQVSAMWMPNGRSYQFRYNNYAQLARVELPTGGVVEYDWVNGYGFGTGYISGLSYDEYSSTPIYRRMAERRVYGEGGTLEYRMTLGGPQWLSNRQGYVQEDHFAGNGTPLGRTRHYYFGIVHPSVFPVVTNATDFYQPGLDGREYQTDTFNNDGSTLLRRTAQTFAYSAPPWYDGPIDHAPALKLVVLETSSTFVDTNQVCKQTFSYDYLGNKTDVYDYDYGIGQAGPLLRRTHTDYLRNTLVNNLDYTAANIHILDLPTQQWVSSDIDGNNKLSRTVYEYDNYVTDSLHAPLLNRPSISGLDAVFTTSYLSRGNVTKVTGYSDAQNSTGVVSVASQYDIAGSLVKAIDARGHATTLEYSDRFGMPDAEARANYAPVQLGGQLSYAFMTSATYAQVFMTYFQYDYHTGKNVDSEDFNGTVNSVFYNDPLNRQTQVIIANNIPALRNQKTIAYDDANRMVTVTGDVQTFNDNVLKSETLYDGFGRTTLSRKYEQGMPVVVSTQYDALGRIWKVSNPYRTGDTALWTTTSYDTLGRVTNIKTPDNAEIITAYSGSSVTATDQTGKQRKSITDALGRLTSIFEAPNDPLNYNFHTSYVYDVLGNLRTVTQGSQKRYFFYDSLSRLIRVRSPEQELNTSLNLSSDSLTDYNNQWTAAYTYDGNGNPLTKTDARGATTGYAYDSLNRVTQRSYSGLAGIVTPTVTYTYDASEVANSKGKMTSVNSSVSAYNYTSYDALGRPTASQQVTDGQIYSMGYTYGIAGNMTSQTYPSGRVITQNIDSVGRLANISGQATGETPKTYANSFGYTAHGAIEKMRFGSGRWEHTHFNNRQQLTEIGLGSSATNSSILKLNYDYGTTANNGTVVKQVITIPTIGTVTGFTATQHYQYDQMNRVTGAQEVNGTSSNWQSGGAIWQQMFGYDRYGNRTVDTVNTTSTMVGPNPQISASTNRITPRTSPLEYYAYDAAGNLTRGQSGDAFSFNGDNKLVQYEGGATHEGGADYFYDGDGNRVKKAKPSETTIFVYNISGQLVAEYTTSSPQNNGTSYFTKDPLGTPRVITKADGSVRARHDYLPFGEELYAGVGSRTTLQGYDQSYNPADKTRQKFSAKERDNETGLDYSINRYYSGSQGRFTSADPYLIVLEMTRDDDPQKGFMLFVAYASEPQNWNQYAYCLNDPVNLIDPSGLRWLTKDRETFEWVPDDEYRAEDWVGWETVEAGTIVYFGESFGSYVGRYEELRGSYVVLNGDGTLGSAGISIIDESAEVSEQIASAPNVEYSATNYGGGFLGMGTIVDSNGKVHFTLQIAPSWPPASYSRMYGDGPVVPGVYGQGTVGSLGIVISRSINLLHPTTVHSKEGGFGSPQASAGVIIILPACEGTTPHDWKYHPDNPNREGLMWRSVGRSPF